MRASAINMPKETLVLPLPTGESGQAPKVWSTQIQEMVMFTKTCATCLKEFETQKVDGNICYDCALQRVTGGSPPEEGDFNTARIASGTMTEEQERWLRMDLEAVEGGVSHPDFEPEEWPDDYEDDYEEGGY